VARERQIEFRRLQTHDRRIVPVMFVLCTVCIVVVALLLALDVNGPFIGPW
jgi:hypothetical protein